MAFIPLGRLHNCPHSLFISQPFSLTVNQASSPEDLHSEKLQEQPVVFFFWGEGVTGEKCVRGCGGKGKVDRDDF